MGSVSGTFRSSFELLNFLHQELPHRIECFNLPGNCYTSLAWTSYLTHSLK